MTKQNGVKVTELRKRKRYLVFARPRFNVGLV